MRTKVVQAVLSLVLSACPLAAGEFRPIRELAQELLAEEARLRAKSREQLRLEEELEEQWLAESEAAEARGEFEDADRAGRDWVRTEIPF